MLYEVYRVVGGSRVLAACASPQLFTATSLQCTSKVQSKQAALSCTCDKQGKDNTR
jgi:hypothetical protein